MEKQDWFVLMTKPGRQDEVALRLKEAGFAVFNPKLNQYSKKRSKYIVQPLFPLYLFARLNIEKDFKMINYTRGVLRILGIGRTPHPINENIISVLINRCGSGELVKAKHDLEDIKTGDKVQIANGPLEGIEAIVSGVYGEKQRIEILLDLMKISIDKKDLKKV
ncbi:MAG: transcription termination/antitermination NusG family protein [bacterium]